jgi:glycosyltransferase involved in cell wall biosynthesis
MRIAVINLTGGGMSGGHRKYLVNMLPRLAASAKVEAILCASPATLGVKNWLPPMPKVAFTDCRPFRFLRHSLEPKLRGQLDEFKPDVVFVSLERHIEYHGAPVVTMIQNMAPLLGAKTGDGIKETLKSWARRREAALAVKHAVAIIAPTDFVKDFVVKNLGVDKEKIAVIHYGHNSPHPNAEPPGPLRRDSLDRFVFTAGSMENYRGLEDLIEAVSLLKKSAPGLKLAVAGGAREATTGYLQRLKDLALDRGVADDVIWLGNIPEAQLSWCYSHCSAFVVTSRVESFCLVALEALAHGCLCVSSDSPCLPEIFKDCSLYYKAGDAAGLAKALSAVLDQSPAQRAQTSVSAKKRAAQFSWDSAAEMTLELFEQTWTSRNQRS